MIRIKDVQYSDTIVLAGIVDGMFMIAIPQPVIATLTSIGTDRIMNGHEKAGNRSTVWYSVDIYCVVFYSNCDSMRILTNCMYFLYRISAILSVDSMSRRQAKFKPSDNVDVVPMVVAGSMARPMSAQQQSIYSAPAQSTPVRNTRQAPSVIIPMKDASDDEPDLRQPSYRNPDPPERSMRKLSLSLQRSDEEDDAVIMSSRSRRRDDLIESPKAQLMDRKEDSHRASPLLFDAESPRDKRKHSRRAAYESSRSIEVEPISPSSADSVGSATRKSTKPGSAVNTPRDRSTPISNAARLTEEFEELDRLDRKMSERQVAKSEPRNVRAVSRTMPRAELPTVQSAVVMQNVAITQEVKDGLDIASSLRINGITAKQIEQSLNFQRSHINNFLEALNADQQRLQNTSTGPLYVEDASDYKFSNSVARTVRTWQVSEARSKMVLHFILQYGIPLYTYIVERRNREARLFYMTYLQKFEAIWQGNAAKVVHLPKTLSLNVAIHIFSALLGDTHRMVSVLKTMSVSYVLYEPAV